MVLLHIAVSLKSDDCPPKSRPAVHSAGKLSGAPLPQVELKRALICFMLRSWNTAYFPIMAVCGTHARPSKAMDADKGKAGLCLRRKK
ncbi:hypothetical protein [Rhizobium nepotum]|uniref:hypothetical protein n=1 Tax=Rhizobium nepotum TaxID=1035271 RepID=UPI001269B2CF|nr:hypothetical protein [Rhizobium nepotum]